VTVKERIKEFIKYKDISVRKFEFLCGLSYSYVNNMRVSIHIHKKGAPVPSLTGAPTLTNLT
jgi:hypothetical protein